MMVRMTRLDVIHRELEAYLAELDAERERVRTFLDGAKPVLTTGPDLDVARPTTGPASTVLGTSTATLAHKEGDTAYALRLMSERRDVSTWSAADLLAALTADGWTTGAANHLNAVSAVLSRLARSNQLERRGRGLYAVLRPTNADSPALTGLSVLDPATQEGGGASGTDTHRVRDDPSSWQAEHLDHDLGAPVGTGA